MLKDRGQHVGGNKLEMVGRLLGQEDAKRKPIEKSAVTKLMKCDIFEGLDCHVHDGLPLESDAFYHTRSQYQRYPFEEFERLLEKLREQNEKHKKQAAIDDAEVIAQLDFLGGMEETTVWGYQSWRNHPAKKLLRKDMDEKKHLEMTKKELWLSRDEYNDDLPLDVFRDRVAQESRARKQANWNAHVEEKEDDDSRGDCDSQWSESEEEA